jgi:two-component system, NtrC family, sensor kinase
MSNPFKFQHRQRLFRNYIKNIPKSLVSATLLNMGLRIALVFMLLALISYAYLMRTLETGTRMQLEKYVIERGKHEEQLFQLAVDNHAVLKQELLKRLSSQNYEDSRARFEKVMYKWTDGTTRNAPESLSPDKFDTENFSTVYIGKEATINTEIQRRILTFYDLTNTYGPAWQNRFANTYINSPENCNSIYWRGYPLALQAKNLNILQEEFFYVSDKKHNKQRQTAWTGVYLDPSVKVWMVSAETPVDDASGRHIATIGHDIILSKLIQNTIEDKLPGTYNFIFQEDGRLIAHPYLVKEIEEKEGKFNISNSGDRHLQRTYKVVKAMQPGQFVIDNQTDGEFVAITRLAGVNWYFVTVYPKSLLTGVALADAKFILLVGSFALFVELSLLFFVLKNKIGKPLHQLLNATDTLAKGNFAVHLDTKRQDELGRIAASFNSMTSQLHQSFALLEKSNTDLETKVEERTAELSHTLSKLKETQMQLVQNEKMSSLDRVVAGIAHEINNPVNFIHGNLTHAREYMGDLRELVQLYQQEYPNPKDAIIQKSEDIELEFLIQDLGNLFTSMLVGTTRIKEIVKSLRTFSRLDEAEVKSIHIHQGIDSTLMILDNRLKKINVIKVYEKLPLVECYAGQLNQVFISILANAIDTLEEKQNHIQHIEFSPTITIRTELVDSHWVRIVFTDNGVGMSEDIQQRIFDPFFTSKPVGKGTGMGLSISYQIITEKHQGKIECFSTPEVGSEFTIMIPITTG